MKNSLTRKIIKKERLSRKKLNLMGNPEWVMAFFIKNIKFQQKAHILYFGILENKKMIIITILFLINYAIEWLWGVMSD